MQLLICTLQIWAIKFREYVKFVQKLLQSPRKELCFLSKGLLNDPRSTLCKNDRFLNDLTNINIVDANKLQMKNVIPIDPIPVNDQWRIRLLQVLLGTRKDRNSSKLNLTKDQLNDMLESLCIIIFSLRKWYWSEVLVNKTKSL